MSRHVCHAPGCTKVVPPRLFACRVHWYALPKPLRDAIWREYAPGQEVTKTPTLRYLAVQTLARGYLAFRPHDEAAAMLSAELWFEAKDLRDFAMERGDGDPFERIDMPTVRDLCTLPSVADIRKKLARREASS